MVIGATGQTIESVDITLGNLFKDYYVVPSYQREYVWEEKEVEQLLEDINTEFSSNGEAATSEYFIGSIVVCLHPDGLYELIDGQQRMTTAFIVLCAIRDHLAALGAEPIAALKDQIASTDVDEEGNNVYRYRLDLQYEDSCDVLKTIAKAEQLQSSGRTTRSVQNITSAYETLRTFLKGEFDTNAQAVKKFYVYFTKNVKLIRVKTISVAHALKVFETINDRGIGLDSMDLLKNLMFMNARADDFNKLKDRWKNLVDTLFKAGEKPLRFLRYFIFARYGVDRLREDEIYQWFTDNETRCGYRSDPIGFVDELMDNAAAYAKFAQGKDTHDGRNRYLDNIRYLSGTARQHLILLLAGRHLPSDCFDELARHIENLFFAYIITREPTREFERFFARWAPELRKISNRAELDAFIAQYIKPAKQNLQLRFNAALSELTEQSIQKYRMRYILGKFAQYVNEKAWGSNPAELDLATFIGSNVDVEHILPQTPSQEVLSLFDKPHEISVYIYRLGNLTVVEKSINCAVGNGVFSAKRTAYRNSKFLLTKTLGEHVVVGVATRVDQAVGELESFETWDSAAIERRHQMLARLAVKVWDMA